MKGAGKKGGGKGYGGRMNSLDEEDAGSEGEEEEFSEKEKEIIKRSSMINTYRLILSNYDFSIFPNTFFWLLTEYEDRSVFDVLLDYFESTEEYEICADIKQIKDNITKANKSRSEKRGGACLAAQASCFSKSSRAFSASS